MGVAAYNDGTRRLIGQDYGQDAGMSQAILLGEVRTSYKERCGQSIRHCC